MINSPVFNYNICGFSTKWQIEYNFNTIRKPIYDFLSNFYWHFLSRTVFEIFDYKVFRIWPWPLTFRGHLRSKIFTPFESPYMTSYLTSIDTFSLSRTVFEIFDFTLFRVWPWPLTFKGHLRSKFFIPFQSPYMTSYLTSIDIFSLSRTVFEIFDFKLFRVWPWHFTFEGHLGSKISIPFGSPYMTSYLTSTDTFSLSRTVFEIFDFKLFRVWPWPLTSKRYLGSKKFIPFKSPYMTSYLTSIDTFSLSRTVLEIFDFKLFRVWPWPLTSKDHLGSIISIPFESPYMTSYQTSIDTYYLSRTVFEIFDFKLFRVWPWPLTSKRYLGSKKFIPFESPYMTSYLTSIDTFFLSRTILEIFDFKLFRVWPWPLTSKRYLGSKKFIPFESPYMTSYLTSIDTFSLSRTVFEIFDFKLFRGLTLTFKGHLGTKKFYAIRKPIHDFLSNFHWHFISISYRFWDIILTSNFLGFDLDLWPLKVIWGKKISYHSKAHIWLPTRLLWTPSLYLVPFSR